MTQTINNIHQHLRKESKTVSIAESITAGHLQAMLTSTSGASDIFQGGITAYKRSVKVAHLGVDDVLAQKHDCVHEEIAIQMALGALSLFDSDYAIATCGYAEVEQGNPYTFIACTQKPGRCLFSGRIDLSGNRIEAQEQAARFALEKFESLLIQESI